MSAQDKIDLLWNRLQRIAPTITRDDAATLRRAEKTLQRWGELECGNSNDHASWAIERDETTGKPFEVVNNYRMNSVRRFPIADREAGALRRVAKVCKAHGLSFYHQGDCRGCMLYVADEPLTDTNYTRGVACCD